MKCLVSSNCATVGYVRNLRQLYPDWDIRGASIDLAEKWLTREPNQGFIDFVAEADMYVGFAPDQYDFLSLRPGAEVHVIPPFLFRGLHPDIIYLLNGRPSVIGKEGLEYSRLATVCYMQGLSVERAAELFNADVYARLGYLDVYEPEKRRLLATFAEAGILLDEAFDRWAAEGNFLFLNNHGKKTVYFDIVWHLAVGRLGYRASEEQREALRAAAECVFSPEPTVWPVYPEIGAKYGISEPFEWQTSKSSGHETLSLTAFLTRTYEHLADFDLLTPKHVTGHDECLAAITPYL